MLRRQFLSLFSIPTCVFSSVLKDENLFYLGIAPWPDLVGSYPYQLRKVVYEAYSDMKSDALKEGLYIQITSGYRSFNHQRNLWNGKYKTLQKRGISKDEILKIIIQYTALPGTSRHHWGTDLDITDGYGYSISNPLDAEQYKEGGEYQFLAWWLLNHAANYGFVQAFTDSKYRTGVQFEPWHFSFLPLAKQGITRLKALKWHVYVELENVLGKPYDSSRWLASYIENYVLGVNPILLPD